MNQNKGHTENGTHKEESKELTQYKKYETVVRQITPRQKKKKRNFLSICLSMAYICSNLF
jgi:hypothetical protein